MSPETTQLTAVPKTSPPRSPTMSVLVSDQIAATSPPASLEAIELPVAVLKAWIAEEVVRIFDDNVDISEFDEVINEFDSVMKAAIISHFDIGFDDNDDDDDDWDY